MSDDDNTANVHFESAANQVAELCARVDEGLLNLDVDNLLEIGTALEIRIGRFKDKSGAPKTKLQILSEISQFIERKCSDSVETGLEILTPLHKDIQKRLGSNASISGKSDDVENIPSSKDNTKTSKKGKASKKKKKVKKVDPEKSEDESDSSEKAADSEEKTSGTEDGDKEEESGDSTGNEIESEEEDSEVSETSESDSNGNEKGKIRKSGKQVRFQETSSESEKSESEEEQKSKEKSKMEKDSMKERKKKESRKEVKIRESDSGKKSKRSSSLRSADFNDLKKVWRTPLKIIGQLWLRLPFPTLKTTKSQKKWIEEIWMT